MHTITIMHTENLPETALTESAALRLLDWPASRRAELRALLPSVPTGSALLYERAAVETIRSKSPSELAAIRAKGVPLMTRNGTATAPPSEIHTRTAEFTRGAIDPNARTVELSFSSEAPVSRWFGNEVLSHAPGSVRLGRLNGGAALLLDHNPEKQIGIVVSARIDPDGKGRAKVRFGKSALAAEIFQDVADGIRRLVSVGYLIHKQETQGKTGGVETVRVSDWEPYEISLVSIPADDSVGVGRAISTHTNPKNNNSVNRSQIIAALVADNINYQDSMSDDQLRSLLPSNSNSAAAERSRVMTIGEIGAQASRSGIQFDERSAIADGLSPEQCRQRVYDSLMSRQSNFTPGAPAPEYSRSEQRDMSRYSLCRAIHMAGQGRLDGLEAEVSQELSRSMGKAPAGFYVPHSALMQRAGMSVTNDSGAYGGDNVGLVIGSFIDALRPMLAVAKLGATVLSGLTSNVSLPRQSAASTATWKPETGDLDERTPAIDQVPLTPKRIGAFTKFSKQLVVQSSPDVEAFVRRDLMEAVAIGFDYAAIAGTGADDQPTGILNTPGIGSVVGGTNGADPTWAHIVALMAAVANTNASGGQAGYLFSTKIEAKFRNTVKVASTDSRMLLEDGQTTLSGKKWEASNNVPDNLTKGSATAICSAIIFGNWADVILASFGNGVDMIVDPYTLATSGQTRVVVNSLCDVGIRRPASFAAMKDALTA
jgi:HK97 family phage major capsid protein